MTPEDFYEITGELPEATLLVQADGLILSANRSAIRCLQSAPGEVVGNSLHAIVAEEPLKVDQALRQWGRSPQLSTSGLRVRCGAEEIDCRCEGARLKSKGNPQPLVLLRVIPRDRSAQQFTLLNNRLEALSQEIRQRRKAEEELRAQREWLHVTLTSIGDAVIATDAVGRVTLMNPVAEKLTGWKISEALGCLLNEVFHIVHEDTRIEAENPVDKVLREGNVVGLANHTVLIARDGTERPIDDSAAPIRGDDAKLRGVVLVFHDVSDRRVLERQLMQRAQELEEADRRKNEFLAILAHELRNPLAPIRTAAQILRLNGHDHGSVLHVAEIVERQSDHLARIVDDLLDISRITRGKIVLRPERVELTQLLHRCLDEYRQRAATAEIRLLEEISEIPIWMLGDRTRLRQIFDNLLDNACKFSSAGDEVLVRLQASPEGRVVFAVKDSGLGLEAEMMKRLFIPFAQADRTLDRSKGGLGLGLALVKGLISLHEGEISAFSDGPGKGAEFVVELARAEESPAIAGEPIRLAAQVVARRILIIEDNHDAAQMLALLIQSMGHQTLIANAGDEGFELALRERPDIVLCDIGLPGLSGHEVARKLRSYPEFSTTRLIAITGYGQEEDKLQAHDAGFDRHFTKPVDPELLIAELSM